MIVKCWNSIYQNVFALLGSIYVKNITEKMEITLIQHIGYEWDVRYTLKTSNKMIMKMS